MSKHSVLLKNLAALVILSFGMIMLYVQIIKERGETGLKVTKFNVSFCFSSK